MRIFFVCQRVPFPPDRGDKITTFNEIRHLSARHEVHVFSPGDGLEDLDNVEGLMQYATSVTADPVTAMGSRLRAAGALFTGAPLSVAAYRKPSLHRTIRRRFDELKPDLIIVYSCNVAQYVEAFASTPRIMQFADLDSLKWGQYAERARPPMSWVWALEQRRLLAYERHIGNSFSRALVCTSNERRDFERLIPGVPVSLVGNGVDLEYFHPLGQPKQAGSMIFTGVMDYLPNVDAVEWFCDAVLPRVQARVPQARLTICGSRPNATVTALAQRPGVTVTGRVPDTRPFMDAAEVFVAPLRMARGIQNKVLEALAMGLPCVASTAAWNGTVLAQGDGIVACDDPEQFADHVVRLLCDDAYRAEMSSKARRAAETHYSWDAQMASLDRVIDELVSPGKAGQRKEAD